MRTIWFRSRYGDEIEVDIDVEHFAELFDSIKDVPASEDWRDVAIVDSEDWCITFTPDVIAFENLEADAEEGQIRPVTRKLAVEMAEAFLDGDFGAIRTRFEGDADR